MKTQRWWALICYCRSSASVRESVRQHTVLQVCSDDGTEATEGLPGCRGEGPEYQEQPDDSGKEEGTWAMYLTEATHNANVGKNLVPHFKAAWGKCNFVLWACGVDRKRYHSGASDLSLSQPQGGWLGYGCCVAVCLLWFGILYLFVDMKLPWAFPKHLLFLK